MPERLDSHALAFFAGVIDARGHISLTARRGQPSPRVRITTKRLELLGWLAKYSGTTIRTAGSPYARRGCSDHCQEAHIHTVRNSAYWNADGERAEIILAACLPYLIEQRAHAVEVLRASPRIAPTRRTEIGQALHRLGWPVPGQELPEPIPYVEGEPAEWPEGVRELRVVPPR